MKKVMLMVGVFMTSATVFAQVYDNSSYYSNNYNSYYGSYDYNVPAPTNYGSYGYEYNYQGNQRDVSYESCAPALSLTLKLGSQNQEVLTLQDYLHDAGYLLAAPNGYFGSGTKAAVIHFQYDKYLPTTGTVGSATREAFNDAICGDDFSSSNNNGSGAYFGNAYNFNKLPAVSDTVNIPTTNVTSFDAHKPQTTTVSHTSQNIGTVGTPISTTPFIPATLNTSGNIAYYPYDPFGRNPLPLPATLTVNPPLKNSVYREGETMTVSWGVTNANVFQYVVTLDNTSTSGTRTVAILPGNQTSTSFVLSKEILDSVCGSACDTSMQQNFRLTIKATLNQQYTETSVLTAHVDPIRIVRPLQPAAITVSVSKSPVNSGETFNLYVTLPANFAQYVQSSSLVWKIRSLCQVGTGITVNGQACGTDAYVYQPNAQSMPEIQATVVNTSWGPQLITFEVSAYTNYGGTVLGSATTNVVVNR